MVPTRSTCVTRPLNAASILLRAAALLGLAMAQILSGAEVSGSAWLPANDPSIARSGEWQWDSHRYAAEPALETRQEGAALEVAFRGRALVLCLDTLTPPNNYGPPELGALDIFVDGAMTSTVYPRASAGEISILRSADERAHRVRLVHRAANGAGARIRGFRIVPGLSGDLAFVLSGEKNGALIDARAILTQGGRLVRDALVRNWLTGECRLGGLPPGTNYSLEVRAAGWTTVRVADLAIRAGEETRLAPLYMARERDVPQDAFTFPAFGYATVRRPGGKFRARFEGQKAEIRSVRLVLRHGPALISRVCEFGEDKAAAFYYHREGTVAVPSGTPAGTYDLEVTLVDQRGARVLVSPRSVAVVDEFVADPVFVSWGHLDTWGQYQAEYVAQLAEIANLLAADMVLVSNEGNPAYAAGALYGLEMPFVINFGNHRGPDPGPWFGPPVGVVDFGSAFTVINFGLAWDRSTAEADQLLAARSATRIRIVNAFESNAPIRDFFDRHGVALIHYAHGPGPAVATLGATPTIRVGKSSSESFRVIRFKEGRPSSFTYRGHAIAPIPFPRGGLPPLHVSYAPANDGTQRRVTATYRNDLDESFPAARAVFVLPQGAYRLTGARMEHAIESDDGRFTVLTVRFDLPAKSKGDIKVEPVAP